MKTHAFKLFAILLMIFAFLNGNAQGLKAPAPGKAVIYFVRVTAAGAAIPFDFYHNDRAIGHFAGRNYLRYETEPGAQLFWASSENHEFLTADLTEGKIYIVIVDAEIGFAVARVGLSPIKASEKVYERARKVIDRKAPVMRTEETLRKKNEAQAEFIQDKLTKYHEKWKDTRKYKHLSADMAIAL
jgi:hypothetical protein